MCGATSDRHGLGIADVPVLVSAGGGSFPNGGGSLRSRRPDGMVSTRHPCALIAIKSQRLGNVVLDGIQPPQPSAKNVPGLPALGSDRHNIDVF